MNRLSAAQTTDGGGGTPDGQPPAFEDPCAGEEARAFGLCNAYCEAMDCELGHDPADPEGDGVAAANPSACAAVLDNYRKAKGSADASPACIVTAPEPACPCFGDQDLSVIDDDSVVLISKDVCSSSADPLMADIKFALAASVSHLTVRAETGSSDVNPCELLQVNLTTGVTEVEKSSEEITGDEAAACGRIVDTFCESLVVGGGGGGD